MRAALRIREPASAVGTGSQSFRAADDERPTVVRQRDERREPAGRNVPLEPSALHVDDGDGIETGAGDVEPLPVRAERLAEREHAAQPLQSGEVELDLTHES